MTELSVAERIRLLEPPRRKVRAVLDTDTYNEIDDQFAIVQTLLSPESIDLQAIYAAPFHNHRSQSPGHGMELSHDEILRLLERMGVSPDGFVHRGVTDYVGAAKAPLAAPAVDDMIARARAASPDDPLYIVAIGAISNVASALLAAPDIIDRVVVVWLGGHALDWPDTREFNLRQDVGGAQVLFDCGVPVVLCRAGGRLASPQHGPRDRAPRGAARRDRPVPRAALQGIQRRPRRLVEADLGHGAGRLADRSRLVPERARPDPDPDRGADVERRRGAAADALRSGGGPGRDTP